jgi:hypothetical protein
VGFQAWVSPESCRHVVVHRCSGSVRAAEVLGGPPGMHPARIGTETPPAPPAGPHPAGADRPSPPRRLAAADRHGIADPVVLVGSTAVVVGPVVGGSVLVVVTRVVVVGAAVVVGAVVGGAAVVVGSVTGGWVLVAPRVEDAPVLVVVPAVVGAWPLTGPAVVVGPLTARGPVAEVVVERVDTLVGARGPVVGVNAGLGAGSVGRVGRARAGARLGGAGWGSRVAEATRAARTPVVSPKATSSSRQGHRDLVRCRGGGGRCRGGGVDMGHGPGSTATSRRPSRPTSLGALPGGIPLRRWPHSP